MNSNIQDTNPALKAAVTQCLQKRKNQWPGESSAESLCAIVTSIPDSKGVPIALTAVEMDAIMVACRPTFEVQVRLINRIIESRGVLANADTRNNIERVVNATKFKKELTKAGLITETGGDDLKNLLG